MNKSKVILLASLLPSIFCTAALADNSETELQADSHAPIGVMGDHMHSKGEFMFSYRLMNMKMSGNVRGSNDISSDEIATTIVNPYANPPMSPPTVRVVPQDMTTKMHMLGLMYAPSDDITLMAMLNYIQRDMDLTTYQGAMGTSVLGNFETQSSGMGDSKLAALYRLFDTEGHHLHANIGWIIPTGSIDEEDEVLTPMNTRVSLRLPYSMQLGSGSHASEIGLTYSGWAEQLSWGGQVNATFSLESNDEGYEHGNKYHVTSWAAYELSHHLSGSLRLTYTHSEDISGADSKIVAPVTTANPQNYGVNAFELALGLNTVIANKHRLGLEYQLPINYQVNGVQMEMENMLTLGYQLAF
jgi:hypothetical protein